MMKSKIETLLEAAKSSSDNDTSINLAKKVFANDDDCRAFFAYARRRLFNIDEWKKNSTATDYDLFNESGEQVNTEPIEVGKFIRIALYGAGKYDWVRVSAIHDEPDEVVMTVKPTYDPTKQPADQTSISHFFHPDAENNFCLQQHDKMIAFYVIGLSEKQNTKFTDGLIETARNAAVANIGYYSGLQKAVWKEFCLNFLRTEEERAE